MVKKALKFALTSTVCATLAMVIMKLCHAAENTPPIWLFAPMAFAAVFLLSLSIFWPVSKLEKQGEKEEKQI